MQLKTPTVRQQTHQTSSSFGFHLGTFRIIFCISSAGSFIYSIFALKRVYVFIRLRLSEHIQSVIL